MNLQELKQKSPTQLLEYADFSALPVSNPKNFQMDMIPSSVDYFSPSAIFGQTLLPSASSSNFHNGPAEQP